MDAENRFRRIAAERDLAGGETEHRRFEQGPERNDNIGLVARHVRQEPGALVVVGEVGKKPRRLRREAGKHLSVADQLLSKSLPPVSVQPLSPDEASCQPLSA